MHSFIQLRAAVVGRREITPAADLVILRGCEPCKADRLREADKEAVALRVYRVILKRRLPRWPQPLQTELRPAPVPVPVGPRAAHVQAPVLAANEPVHARLEPLGMPEDGPLQFAVHLFEEHPPDAASGEFAQPILPRERAFQNLERRRRRVADLVLRQPHRRWVLAPLHEVGPRPTTGEQFRALQPVVMPEESAGDSVVDRPVVVSVTADLVLDVVQPVRGVPRALIVGDEHASL